jgi:hypothetical protein
MIGKDTVSQDFEGLFTIAHSMHVSSPTTGVELAQISSDKLSFNPRTAAEHAAVAPHFLIF